jgi:hypothetical protein
MGRLIGAEVTETLAGSVPATLIPGTLMKVAQTATNA